MLVAVILLVVILASVAFHVFTPWWLTPLASNWKTMDDTLWITLVITGVFFVVINLFVVYALWRFRHREGSPRAQYASEAHNKKLERWLIGITSVGIAALLAPGLVVYANYIKAPKDALVVEVVAQQWQWRFRFPGAGDKLGLSDVRFVNGGNPLGLDPEDAAAQDDVVISGNEIHLPLGRPVKVLARAHDVLHDFFVPQFRARMNIVPGQVSQFWFTPSKPGRYEAMCAQLCGVGHPNMRGYVVVEDEAKFQAWLKSQPTFAQTQQPAAPAGGLDLAAAQGKALAQSKGCAGCHSVDGSPGVGPTWKGLYGKSETTRDGGTALVDDAYLTAFIKDPKASRGVKGFTPVMPQIPLTDPELASLVAYIKSHASAAAATKTQQ
jgi:cytochrome c oxidase subunit II